MSGMGDHSGHFAAGAPLRRAHRAAWFTFIFMAGTTMTFQTYHSVESGQMPWPLAALFGIAAFTLAITVLEFSRHSPSKWVRGGAYALTGGAMYMSASATGDVVLHAAPPHASLLFGFLMDGAAILAIHFIFNGPTAAHAVAEVARRESELKAEAEAARDARNDADRALRELREQADAQMAEARRVHQLTVSVLEDRVSAARSEAETATAKAEASARKLAAATGRGKAGSATRKPAGNSARKPEAVPAEAAPVNADDLPGNWDALDTEARVLALVDKGYSASKAGIVAGVTDARGRQIARLARDLSATAPQDVVGEAKEG